VDELKKKKQMDAIQIYDLLCDMVHPNFGSNALIISTRERIDDLAGNIVLARHPKHREVAAWFFEVGAEPLGKIFQKELEYTARAKKLLLAFQSKAATLDPGRMTFAIKPDR
jgi:hypothetical protein